METAAHFDNIPEEISRRFNAATAEIILVGNWFSEHSLFDALCQQAGRGLPVRLVVPEKEIVPPGGRLNLQRLRDIGGTVFELPEECDLDQHMPHRFCVIDRHTVILGDRTTQASEKHITVISNSTDIGVDYLNAFNALLRRSDPSTVRDNSDIRPLLDTFGHYALLEEWEAITARLAAHHLSAPELQPLLAILESRDSWAAIEWIDNFLANTTAMTVATDQDIALLRLNLRSLELQFTALSDEKAEIDRQVHAFSLRTNHEVGKLLTQYLELRARKLRQLAGRPGGSRSRLDRLRRVSHGQRAFSRKQASSAAPSSRSQGVKTTLSPNMPEMPPGQGQRVQPEAGQPAFRSTTNSLPQWQSSRSACHSCCGPR